MNKLLAIATLLAATTLGGCVTYDHVGQDAPGGYYYGRPTVEYYDPYGGYSPYGYGSGVSLYGRYGYGGYGGYPYYGHYGPYYPYYRPHHPPPRPPRPGGDTPDPPTSGPSKRPPPWRDPTNGAYRESGQVMIPPRFRQPAVPAPSSPQIRREAPSSGVSRPAPQPRSEVARPRAVERAARPSRPAVRSGSPVRTQEP